MGQRNRWNENISVLIIEGIIMLRSSLNGFSGPHPEGGKILSVENTT